MKTFTLIVAWGVVLLLSAFSANLLASEVFYLPNGMQVILKENHTDRKSVV